MKIRKGQRLPRILRINRIDRKQLLISVLFRNGENRILDFKRILKDNWKVRKTTPDYALYTPEIFANVRVDEAHGLSWDGIQLTMRDMTTGKAKKVSFDVGADTLYDLSEPDPELSFSVGEMVKKARLAAKLTQDEVAQRCGTSRTYITRLENDQQDIELMTLKKIVEAGLNKRLRISIA